MKIAIAGGSGFIGKKLTSLLRENGHDVFILTRRKNIAARDDSYIVWLQEGVRPEEALQHIDAFVNLAGVSINEGRWTKRHQKKIYDSRMQATKELLRIMDALPQKPSIWINASAVGIYPTSKHAVYTENSPVAPHDFLGKTVYDWEGLAKQAENYGARVAFMRFGVVLGKDSGALPLMSLPYKLFAGGTVGSGKQWLSWVHVTDVVRAICFVIEHETLSGPVNVTAPNPLRMKAFGKTIASVLNRPHWIPAPSPAMKVVLGKKSKLVLEGQHVQPTILSAAGFEFSYPTLKPALKNLFGKGRSEPGSS